MLIDAYLERNEAQRTMKSPEECLDLLRDFTGLEEDNYHAGKGRGIAYLFRGHDDASYPLRTTLDRKVEINKRQAEDFFTPSVQTSNASVFALGEYSQERSRYNGFDPTLRSSHPVFRCDKVSLYCTLFRRPRCVIKRQMLRSG